MKAFILAAGRGERMRPLTDHTPKPLLVVRGKPLLQRWVETLRAGGVEQIVVNTAWLGEQIESHFGLQRPPDGREQLLNQEYSPAASPLRFSCEGRDFGYALETAGGIARALPLLAARADDIFWVVAGDIFAPDFVCAPAAVERFAASSRLAHLWLVPNPAHNPQGDFGLAAGRALNLPADSPMPRYTYSTIGLFKAALFSAPWCALAPGNPTGQAAPLAPLLRRAMDAGRVGASLYTGRWTDVGTPQRWAELQQ